VTGGCAAETATGGVILPHQKSDLMTKTELGRFRKALEIKQAEVGGGGMSRQALTIETSPDELDRIQNASERDYAMRDLERNSSRLREVKAALGRMDAGTFGICGNCAEPIHLKRLAAVPWTWFCIACQEIADRNLQSVDGEAEPTFIEAA
jgi:DnaK suppressor protein